MTSDRPSGAVVWLIGAFFVVVSILLVWAGVREFG